MVLDLAKVNDAVDLILTYLLSTVSCLSTSMTFGTTLGRWGSEFIFSWDTSSPISNSMLALTALRCTWSNASHARGNSYK